MIAVRIGDVASSIAPSPGATRAMPSKKSTM